MGKRSVKRFWKQRTRIIDRWVMVVTGAIILASVLFVVVTTEWTWFDVTTSVIFVVCGVVLVAKGLRQ